MKFQVLLIAVLMCISSLLRAAPEVAFHGFLAQGVVQSVDSEFISDKNSPTFDLTEAGINTRVTFSNKLQFVAQGVYLQSGNRFPEGTRLDYAFLDYTVLNSEDWQVNIHLGRYKNIHWLYSATQDIPHTRPTAILPQSVYSDFFRDVSLSSDGAAIIAQHDTSSGTYTLNWSLGRTEFSSDLTQSLLGDGFLGDAEQRYVHQTSAYWTSNNNNWHVGISFLDSEFEYTADINELISDGQAFFERYQMSLRYSTENFELTSEIFRESLEATGIPELATDRIGDGGYVQLRYFVSPNVSLIGRYDSYVADRDDRRGRDLEQRFNGLIPNYAGYMDTVTVGLRWNFAHHWRLQAEQHWVEGTGRIDPLAVPGLRTPSSKHWQMTAIQVMTWF